ncbi:MAG: SRPBCC domain-containing protein [Chitinophagaceae bacterium]
MKNENYHSSIAANVTAGDAFNAVCTPTAWWGKSITGNTEKLKGVFKYHPNDTWVDFEITEYVPNKKVVWHVTDCFLHFQNNKTEWKGTDVVFEIAEKDGSTQIDMTHVGLVPAVECYAGCVKGWDQYFKGSLLQLLTTGKGQPS